MPPVGLSASLSDLITCCPAGSTAAAASCPMVRPVTVFSSGCRSPASNSRLATTGMPPAWNISGAV